MIVKSTIYSKKMCLVCINEKTSRYDAMGSLLSRECDYIGSSFVDRPMDAFLGVLFNQRSAETWSWIDKQSFPSNKDVDKFYRTLKKAIHQFEGELNLLFNSCAIEVIRYLSIDLRKSGAYIVGGINTMKQYESFKSILLNLHARSPMSDIPLKIVSAKPLVDDKKFSVAQSKEKERGVTLPDMYFAWEEFGRGKGQDYLIKKRGDHSKVWATDLFRSLLA